MLGGCACERCTDYLTLTRLTTTGTAPSRSVHNVAIELKIEGRLGLLACYETMAKVGPVNYAAKGLAWRAEDDPEGR